MKNASGALALLAALLLGVPPLAAANDSVFSAPRRLTQLEYIHSLQDLLSIPEEAAREVAKLLPPEADTGDFDTIATNQGISGLHVRGYLEAADAALDAAILLGPRPDPEPFLIDYTTGQMAIAGTLDVFGLGVVRNLEDASVIINETYCTYAIDSRWYGFEVERAGEYRLELSMYPWQATSTVVANLYRGTAQGTSASLDEQIAVWDLADDSTRTESVITYLRPGDLLAPCVAELDTKGANPFVFVELGILLNESDYPGEGIAFKYLTIEGPLYDTWPPLSTRSVLEGIEFTETGDIRLTRSPEEHLEIAIASFAERAFRRPLEAHEIASLVALALPFIDEGRPFIEALRVSLAAILASPEFLYVPQVYYDGDLDDYEFAARLAYLLWRSAPDDELLTLADRGALSDPAIVGQQVDRMLEDVRAWRFVKDYAGQAWRLDEINKTTPSLSFRYDAQLGKSMELETQLFLAELIKNDLPVANLIDSDFMFVNRPLAQLYDIDEIVGQDLRRIDVPAGSPRGGLLTQGSILKITANGTNTSPVPRGNWVLGPLLGTPTPPPPPTVMGLEPDTRGTTTIREQLDAHRTEPVCNTCHQLIDPPGFALEQFDPIGGFRTNYTPRLPVDATGVTPSGRTFDGIVEYKAILLEEQEDQVARNLILQLFEFGTGSALEREDSGEVNAILNELRPGRYRLRALIRAVATSNIFRRR